MPDAGYLTIGKVVKRLQVQYPDLSVSKVRYLEDEGLLTPSRTPGGYRLYSQHDIRRLETILYLQKNRFMPLQVIKEELAKGDVGLSNYLAASDRGEALGTPSGIASKDVSGALDSRDTLEKYHALSRMPELLGVSHGRDLVDGRDFPLIRTCEELRQFGIGPKNLRQYVQAANRESGLFEQALTIYGRSASHTGGPTEEQRERYQQALSRILALTNGVRESLIRKSLKRVFTDMED